MKVLISNLLQKMKMTQKQPKAGGSPVSINPLFIIAVVFAASFAGRAVGIANAALNKPAEEKAETAPHSDMAPPAQLVAETEKADADGDETSHANESAHAPAPVAAADSHTAAATTSAAQATAQYTELMAAIRERSHTLDNKSVQVEDRIRTLEILEGRIEEKTCRTEKK